MARRELGPAALAVARAVAEILPPGPVIVGCSGGADSMALAMGARWAAPRCGTDVTCVVIDHALQPSSDAVAHRVVALLSAEGMTAESRRVSISADAHGGPEASAREARLEALAVDGSPVLLGHTMDDQAEQVLLGLLRGSGTRSLSGMASVRGPFIRPLLELRRATTVEACREWGVQTWQDPHNEDERFRRVRARQYLGDLSRNLSHDVAPALVRTATLARMDADLLDELATDAAADVDLAGDLPIDSVLHLPGALRLRIVRDWTHVHGASPVAMAHVMAIDALITSWRGQGPVSVPGGAVERRGAMLHYIPR